MSHWIGFLEEQFYEGLIDFLWYLVALLIDSIQESSCVSTLQDNALSSGCFTSSRMVWNLGIILNFSLVQLVDCKVMMALFEDKQSLGREECNVPIFGFSCSASGDDFRGLCQPNQRGNLILTMILDGLEELYDAFICYSSLRSLLHSQFSIPRHFDRSRNLGALFN
jgi:hypothetical protein